MKKMGRCSSIWSDKLVGSSRLQAWPQKKIHLNPRDDGRAKVWDVATSHRQLDPPCNPVCLAPDRSHRKRKSRAQGSFFLDRFNLSPPTSHIHAFSTTSICRGLADFHVINTDHRAINALQLARVFKRSVFEVERGAQIRRSARFPWI